MLLLDLSEDSGVRTKLKSGSVPPIPPIGRIPQYRLENLLQINNIECHVILNHICESNNESVNFINSTKIPCFTDYEEGPLQRKRETEHSAEFSEDTDCDGSSLPEDSPEVQIKLIRLYETTYMLVIRDFYYFIYDFLKIRIPGKWSGRRRVLMTQGMKSRILNFGCTVVTFRILYKLQFLHALCFQIDSYLQMTSGQPEEDEITWGSDELPIENMNSKSRDGKHHFL